MTEERSPEENAASVNLLMLDKEVEKKVGGAIIKLFMTQNATAGEVDRRIHDLHTAMDDGNIWYASNLTLEAVAGALADHMTMRQMSPLYGQISKIAREEIKNALHQVTTTL